MAKCLRIVVFTAIFQTFIAGVHAGTIDWSGYTWQVRNDTGGPGPNTFKAENVRAADDGTLHLKISRDEDRWTCCELTTTESLGYGTYEFCVQSKIDQLDRNVVLGLFSYPEPAVGPDGTNELDIEFSRWGKVKNPNGNFTVWPVVEKQHNASSTFELKLKQALSTYSYNWTPGSVAFESFEGTKHQPAGKIANWTTPATYAKSVGHSPMPLHINLWLFKGKPPTDAKPVEVILKSFAFHNAG